MSTPALDDALQLVPHELPATKFPPFESCQVALRDSAGRVLSIIETIREALQRKRAGLMRHDLAAIVESSDDAIIGKTLETMITSWNRGAERLYGYRAEEVIGRPISILIPADMPDELPAIMERIKSGHSVDHYETSRVTKDGRRLKISLTVSPIADGGGRIVGASAVARDITEQARVQEALRESEERLQAAAQAAGFGMYDNRGPGRIYWSPQLLELLGLPPDADLNGGEDTAAELIHPEDRERWDEAQATAHDPAGSGVLDIEYRMVRPGGRVIWVAQKGRVFFAGDGPERHSMRAVGFVRDITRRIEGEAQLRATVEARDQALAEAQAALHVRDEFLSSISHDLRTPLTTMRGLVQLAERRLQRGNEQAVEQAIETLASAGLAANRMSAMIDELLDLSRLESGRPLDLNLQPVDLVALIRQSVDEHQRDAPNHRLMLTPAEAELTGVWDAARLERVVANLLSNAIKYSPDGGRVGISVRRTHSASGTEWVEVAVEDEGIGIPAADLRLIFRRFYRAANVPPQSTGTGIGLAGARRIAELHGGALVVESKEGKGSRFTLRLPLNTDDQATTSGDTPASDTASN